MEIGAKISATVAFLLFSMVSAAGEHGAGSPLSGEIALISKSALPSCGIALTTSEARASLDCAKTASAQDLPFVIQLRVEGIDSVVWIAALQLPSGRRVLLQHDDFGRGHITRLECRTFTFPDALLPIRCER